jgi:hypothetical protein
MRGADATDTVTVRAGGITRRNFTTRVVGQRHGPFGHYRKVVFTVRQGTEARALTANADVEFVAGAVVRKGRPLGSACFAKHWHVDMNVSPY